MEEQQFIHAVAQHLSVDREAAQRIVAAVFHELHDRITSKEASDAAAQMPAGLKRLWTASEFPGREVRRIHKSEFMREVSQRAEISEIDAPRAVRAVFAVLQRLLKSPSGQEGEAWDIYSQLPKDLKKVWTAAAKEQTRRQ